MLKNGISKFNFLSADNIFIWFKSENAFSKYTVKSVTPILNTYTASSPIISLLVLVIFFRV